MECASAFARLERAGRLDSGGVDLALDRLERLCLRAYEVGPSVGLRELAKGLLRLHDLRAADALQLAAACEWGGRPASGAFLTLDSRLAMAAQAEGFVVLDT